MANITKITSGIKISVESNYEGAYFQNYQIQYAFSYIITIENQGHEPVQLLKRHWDIFDALNNKEVVDGDGVIGEQPIISPGQAHSYSSGCLLNAPFGTMKGHYLMSNIIGYKEFKAMIPAFNLSAPFALN